jgi:hypothetical protein
MSLNVSLQQYSRNGRSTGLQNEADNKTIKQAIMHVVLGDNVDGIYPSTRMKESIAKLLEEKTTQQEIQTLLRQRIRPFLSKRCEEAFLKVYGSHDNYKDGISVSPGKGLAVTEDTREELLKGTLRSNGNIYSNS